MSISQSLMIDTKNPAKNDQDKQRLLVMYVPSNLISSLNLIDILKSIQGQCLVVRTVLKDLRGKTILKNTGALLIALNQLDLDCQQWLTQIN